CGATASRDPCAAKVTAGKRSPSPLSGGADGRSSARSRSGPRRQLGSLGDGPLQRRLPSRGEGGVPSRGVDAVLGGGQQLLRRAAERQPHRGPELAVEVVDGAEEARGPQASRDALRR